MVLNSDDRASKRNIPASRGKFLAFPRI